MDLTLFKNQFISLEQKFTILFDFKSRECLFPFTQKVPYLILKH